MPDSGTQWGSRSSLLGALGTQQAAPRPNSPGGRSFLVSHFGVGPGEATHHLSQGPGLAFPLVSSLGGSGGALPGAMPGSGGPFPRWERRRSEVLGPRPSVLGGPRQLPGVSHLRLPLGFLSDFLSSNLRSSTQVKRRPGARCPGASTGPTFSLFTPANTSPHNSPHPHPAPPAPKTSPSHSWAFLSSRDQAAPLDRNNFRLMAVWLHQCQGDPYPAPSSFTPTTSDLGPQPLVR